jgi:putative Holliday junction resolvase
MFIEFDELLGRWSKNKGNRKLIGLDWGEKRIGVAISDRSGIIASPLCTVLHKQNKKKAVLRNAAGQLQLRIKTNEQLLTETAQDIANIVLSECPIAINIGMPLNMDGSSGFQAKKVVNFANAIADVTPVPILFTDERLSSAAIERAMIDADMTRAQRTKCIDQTSAAYVLQMVVDKLNRAKP